MKKFLQLGDEKSLREIIDHIGKKEKIDIIIAFISILELARLEGLSISNEDTSEIYLRVVSALDNFDVREADGFDGEEEEKHRESEIVEKNQHNNVPLESELLEESVENIEFEFTSERLENSVDKIIQIFNKEIECK